MRHASLFTGFGGFDYAASQIGWENVFQVENNEYCNKILALRFKNTKRYLDIKEFSGKEYYGKIDIISGGFPCQPFSVAGEQRGKEDDRYLWPEMLRVVSEIRPAWVVGENVAGIGSIFQYEMLSDLEGKVYSSPADAAIDSNQVHERIGTNILYMVIQDLEKIGYSVQVFVIPACGINATHRRDRVWIVAHSECERTWSTNKQLNNERREPCKSGRESIRQEYRKIGSSRTNTTGEYAIDSESERKLRSPGEVQEKDEKVQERIWNAQSHYANQSLDSITQDDGSQVTGQARRRRNGLENIHSGKVPANTERERCTSRIDNHRERSGDPRERITEESHKNGMESLDGTRETLATIAKPTSCGLETQRQPERQVHSKQDQEKQTDNAINELHCDSDGAGRKGERTEFHDAGPVRLPSGENAGWRTLEWPTEPPLCGTNDGVSSRVDRLHGLGNSVVPQLVYEIFFAINTIHYS